MHVLSVSRFDSGLYFWSVGVQGVVLVEGDPEHSISACLRAALPVVDAERIVELAYHGLTIATVTVQALKTDPGRMADWITQCAKELVEALRSDA